PPSRWRRRARPASPRRTRPARSRTRWRSSSSACARRRGARQGGRGRAGGGRCLMVYLLLVPLARDAVVFNVFRYITFRAAMATMSAIVISFVLGPWMIQRLRVMQHGEDTIREDTPARHRAKAGTPTMGGLVILAAI